MPLTQPWFLGVANIRGNLFSASSTSRRFLGREPAAAGGQTRLVLFGPRAGELNAGIVVQRVLGLRNLAELAPRGDAAGAPAWYAQRWMDGDGNAWQEIDLAKLAQRSCVPAGRGLGAAGRRARESTAMALKMPKLFGDDKIAGRQTRPRHADDAGQDGQRRAPGYDPLASVSIMEQLRTASAAPRVPRKLPVIGSMPVVKQFQVLGVLHGHVPRASRR